MNHVPGRRSLRGFDFDGTLSAFLPCRTEARLRKERISIPGVKIEEGFA